MPYLRSSDGVELFYRDWGAGRPVVLLHGLQLSSATWQHQMLYLAENGCRAVSYDRRGHGRSDDPGRGYDFDRLADDLAALLDGLDLSEVTLVGHSMGGAEITRYLSRHGGRRIARIALVSSTVPGLAVDAESADALLDRYRRDYGQWVEENAALSFGDGLPGCHVAELDKQRAIQDWMDVSLMAAVSCTIALQSTDFSAELREIPVPALIVHGDHDPFAPFEMCGRQAAELIPDNRLTVYPDAAHMPHLSHRARLNADLLGFVGAEPDHEPGTRWPRADGARVRRASSVCSRR